MTAELYIQHTAPPLYIKQVTNMKFLIIVISIVILSGCIQTKKVDGTAPATIIQSGASQRNSILLSRTSGMMYCPDAPAEIARSYDGNGKGSATDVAGNSVTAEGALKALVVNLSNRTSATNVLVYSLNSLCFLAMNGSMSQQDVNQRFTQIIEAVTKISTVEIDQAKAAKSVAEAAKNNSEAEKNRTETAKNETSAEKAKAEAAKNATETKKIEAQLEMKRFNLQNKIMN